MLETSFGLIFFLKRPNPELADGMRYVYCRVTVNGIPKDISTKRIWHPSKWSVGAGRAAYFRYYCDFDQWGTD